MVAKGAHDTVTPVSSTSDHDKLWPDPVKSRTIVIKGILTKSSSLVINARLSCLVAPWILYVDIR